MYDGLTCAFNKVAMGNCAEETIKKHGITREAQDEYCIESYKRAAAAYERGFFNSEIATVTIADRKGTKEVSIDEDYAKVKFDKVPMLKPVFGKDGTITAANASSINDGGVALILMSEAKATELNLAPIARILGYGDAATSPVHFGEAPYGAVMQALERAGKTLNDVDLHEINEAFSSVVLVNMKLLRIDHSIVNVNGGAVSIGHPIGASGGRILATLIYALKEQGKKLGMASICNGGGGASAVLLESL
jgi:acetyl-CoA C-acetyltransferase